MANTPLSPVRRPFRAAAVTFVPELSQADEAVWDRLDATIARALASRPPAVVRQLVTLVRLLDLAARLTSGRSLDRLAPERRAALLHRLERAPLLLLRRGVWGLRTLVFMGYYTQPRVIEGLGYRASAAGWDAFR